MRRHRQLAPQAPRRVVEWRRHASPPSATGVLTIDLGQLRANWRDAGQARRAGRMRRRRQGRRLRPRRSTPSSRRSPTSRLPDLLRRHARRRRRQRARSRPAPPSTCSTACCPARARDYAGSTCVPCCRASREVRDWAALASGARAHGRRRRCMSTPASTGSACREARLRQRWSPTPALMRSLDIALVMSHLACADDARPRHERARSAPRFERLLRAAAAGARQPRRLRTA